MASAIRLMKRLGSLLPVMLALTGLGDTGVLTSLEYRINGTGLQVSPAVVSVPKGISGSVLVTLVGGEATQALAAGAYVEAFLRGPGIPEPRRIVSAVNQPMLFPPLNLVGDYQLDSIRLVDSVTGETRMEGSPSIVPVRVFDEILVSRVTSRPLTYEEIQEKGIFIDESNFRVVEFEAAFVLDGKTIPVLFPVVSPKFLESLELIPAAELEEKLTRAAILNQQISSTTVLPPEFEVSQLNIQVQGINFQVVDPGADEPLGLRVPPIPALMVIPGNIGYLNQFFSVQIFTENGAPRGSGLSVYNIKGELKLPKGPDQVAAADYAHPGDDPLRFARIGPDKLILPIQSIVRPGVDGKVGTPDDSPRLSPGESGQAEFLVEGLQEGLHVMDLDLTADMDGLAAGPVKVKGKAAGSVLVRNPRFSMAFSHPRTVRVGEPYEASVTLLNTGITPANLLQVTLNKNSISGARLEDESQQTVELGTLMPGQTVTATFRMRSLRTGAVSFSNLTTSDDSVVGRFRLSMGVDERGVALSPDTIAMPDQVNSLPPDLLFAATRVLGQALSIATAGQVPPGLLRVGRSIITRRVLDLAEAGQRLSYGDPPRRVYADLLRDWQGGRDGSTGFDQILRETDAGREWRDALFAVMEKADNLTGTGRLVDRAADYAGLGQSFLLAGANDGRLRIDYGDDKDGATVEHSTQPYSLVYRGTNGIWANALVETNAVVMWTFTNGPPVADMSVLLVSTNGTARQLRWTIANPPIDARYAFALNDPSEALRVDLLTDGTVDSTRPPTISVIRELPPTLLAVEQDLYVVAGRPGNPCIGPDYLNYGTIVAVVFSKPMTQETAGDPAYYSVDGDNGANSVRIQPGGRVAYLNLRKGISAIRPRSLTTSGVADARGNTVADGTTLIRSVERGTEVPFTGGVAIRGRAIKGDGSPAPGIPVTLTMYDQVYGPYGCEAWTRRVSQVLTDASGNFDLDFVMSGIPYSISATDTSGLSEDALTLIAANTADGQVERERILQLATGAATRDSLLALFSSGSIPEAIAKVEGLDRALVRDIVQIDSSREGQTVPIALRFRGRATVVGQVVAADGVTPVPRPAVNLFPDSGSRELGRGIFADNEGRFVFYGVPLGVYTVGVETSDRRTRTVAGLLKTPGEVVSIQIALPSTITPQGGLRGTVYESDNITPHANARVFIGRQDGNAVRDVVRIVDADADGNWQANDLPAREFDIVAVSFDGRRKGVRQNFSVAVDVQSVANVTLESTTLLFGRVQFEDGRPAANALVAGGLSLVRTDAVGNFSLEGVPVGRREISAGLERNPEAGIDFPRLGSASVNVVAGGENYVVVKLRSAGRIYGRVTDLNGAGIGGIRVAIPVTGGFYWTDADSRGNYVFENMALGDYTLSAPANATSPQLDVSELTAQIRSGNEDDILAAFEEAVRVFVGADDPLVTGEHKNFRPITWGFTTAALRFDGQSVEANVRMLREGTVTGRVLNHQGVPIGARVRLTGLGPAPNGEPKITIRGERDSDPATGLFIFPGQLLVGPWSVQVASPFYPSVIQVSGFTTEIDRDATNVVLQFPPIRDTNGRLAGRVLKPDGTAVGEGVRVKINFSGDYEIRTDTNGFFDTQILVPAGGYRAEAIDDESGLRGEAYVAVAAGQTNYVDVRLLTHDSTVEVRVVRANGQPAAGAQVDLEQGSFPRDGRITVFADTAGRAVFSGLWEGRYAASAQYTESSTRLFSRGGADVGPNQTAVITLRLGGTGSITGQFLKLDRQTPVEAAQVSIGNLGFATTGADGRFRFDGVPLGTHGLVTSDPVTGAFARAVATISSPGQFTDVLIIEGARGEVNGYVIDSYGVSFAAGATVRISYSDGLTPGVTVTTGPDGRFAFPGSPVGSFTVSATDLPKARGGRGTSGYITGVLGSGTLVASVNIQLQPLGTLPVSVVRSDGTTPAQNVTVYLGALQKDTDEQGRVLFDDLSLGGHTVTAISRAGGELHNAGRMVAPVSRAGTNPVVTLRLLGVGTVRGIVSGSDGVTPILGAEVRIIFQAPIFSGETVTAVTGADGAFEFKDVPVGPYRLSAANVSLAATENGSIAIADEVDSVNLRLGDSGTVRGRLVRADGVSPVGGIDVLLTYDSQSANPGRAFVRSTEDGRFRFDNIPVGPFNGEVVAPFFGGLIRTGATLTGNGQDLDLGDLAFDEAFPMVVSVRPTDTSIGVRTIDPVILEFSEALSPASVTANGVFLRSTKTGLKVTSSLELVETNGVLRVVRVIPDRPLVSEQIYEVIVFAGDVLNATGGVIGSGPRDTVGRPLLVSFVSRFMTADNDPPVLLSIFPAGGALQIDPRAVPRLSFNETLLPDGFRFQLVGPEGPVGGQAGVGVDGRVLSFVPADLLKANSAYTLTVSNVFDLAGNRAAGEPFITTFATLDTVGPTIGTLQVLDGRPQVAGTTIPVEATLLANEFGASVRFTQDFVPLGSATNVPYRANVTLPRSGNTTVRAIATDQYGNDGPFKELVLAVQTNQPPKVTFTLVAPPTAPAPSGSFVTVEVLAADDSNVAELLVRVSGLGPDQVIRTNVSGFRVEGRVSADSSPGARVLIIAEATDDVGQSSGPQSFTLAISDGTAPTLVVNSPAEGASVRPGDVVPLSLQLKDGFGVSRVDMTVSGAFETTVQSDLSPVIVNGPATVQLSVPAGIAEDGKAVQVSLVARDLAGNASTPSILTLRIPDRTPPSIVGITPRDAATDVDVTASMEVVFSEKLDTNTVVPAAFLLQLDPDAIPVPVVVSLATDLLTVRVDPVEPLLSETAYQLVIAGTVADPAGNVLGTTVTNRFRTADFRLVRPLDGGRVVEGQSIMLEAASSRQSFNRVRFLTNNVEIGVITAAPFLQPFVVPALGGAGSAPITFGAEALDADGLLLARASVTVTILPGDEDSDGDGVSNADELARGTDPFKPNALPAIQFVTSVEVIQGGVTNLAVTATDPDGNLRRLEVRESLEDGNTRIFGVLQFAETGTGTLSQNDTNVPQLGGSVRLRYDVTNPARFFLRAVDSDGLETTRAVDVTVLADLDGDSIPDRDDPDVDGDGLSNENELAIGTDPRKGDTDGDGIPDGEEVVAGVDGFVTDPLQPDTDADGVGDSLEIALGLDPTNPSDGSREIIVDNRTVTYSGTIRLSTLILTNGAALNLLANDLGPKRSLELIVTNLIVDASSRIEASERGYLGGSREPNSGQSGRTLGNTLEGGSTRRNGGSYGGLGGTGNTGPSVNPVYGSFLDPNDPGSGGGTDSGSGGSGGGLIRITATTINLDGQILANGGNGSSRYSGGGSGGGIKIVTGSLSGSGSIRADGGRGAAESGGGGGGRIAVFYENASPAILTGIQAYGGSGGPTDGTPGTVYLRESLRLGDLIIDGGTTNNIPDATPLTSLAGGVITGLADHELIDRRAQFIPGALAGLRLKPKSGVNRTFRIVANTATTLMTDAADGRLSDIASVGDTYSAELSVDRFAVRNGATIEVADGDRDRVDRRGRLVVGEMEILSGARVTHPTSSIRSSFGLEFIVGGGMTIDADSSVNVSARGFLGSAQDGNNSQSGRTMGNTTIGGSTRRNGGGYGGLGAPGNTEQTVNAVYGTYSDPNDPGSGGGTDSGLGGNGGGLVRITAARVTLDGQILANGGNGSSRYSGGGSGGGVKIIASELSGTGLIQANGGNGSAESGGGGGGRLALLFYTIPGAALTNLSVNGGPGLNVGGAGTTYIKTGSQNPQIVIRNTGRETPLPPTFAGEDLLVDGALVSGTVVSAGSLTLTNGAVLTHPPSDLGSAPHLELNVQRLVIDATSRIDVSERGYLGASRSGNNSQNGRTLGNTVVGGSTRRNGGGYGGLGAPGNQETNVNEVYGSYSDPNDLGSGGGSDSGLGGNGGGLVRIIAASVLLDGQILANGGDGSSRYSGGGSGGGIKITAGALSGSGLIQANGGSGSIESGGGGGGRIALLFNGIPWDALTNLSVNGGSGLNVGGPGTLYSKRGGEVAQIVIRTGGRETPLPETFLGEDLIVDGATVSATRVSPGNLALVNGAILTHPRNDLGIEVHLDLEVTNLVIDATSRIDVSARGYLGAYRGGNNGPNGRTLGNTVVGGSTRRNGGGYGGLGAPGNQETNVNEVYGSYSDPNDLGSGGGSDSGNGGDGGGLVRVIARSVVLHGQILANGGDGSSRYSGGGSGGGIAITVGSMSGAGEIRAHGGSGSLESGGGGGGRVALIYTTGTALPAANLEVNGGGGFATGGAGTLYVKRGSEIPQIVIRSTGRETPLPEVFSGENVVVDGATVVGTRVSPRNLTLINGAVLTHPRNDVGPEVHLDLVVGNLSIDATSRIDVNDRGYLGAQRGGNGGTVGRTLGNTIEGGSTRRNGGSYGGLGGHGNTEQTVNTVYGSFSNPDELGSGGGTDFGFAGNGGGLIRIAADSVALNGQILANGGDGSSRYSGGGSGGGIRISTRSLTGSGRIIANGGISATESSGGSGGRIALIFQTADGFDLDHVESLGGQGLRQAAAGTVYLEHPAQPAGELFVDARKSGDTTVPTQVFSLTGGFRTGLEATRLTDTNALFAPGGLIGLELNPDRSQSRTFTVVANTATEVLTDPLDGDMTLVGVAGREYSASRLIGHLGLRGGAIMELVDGDTARTHRAGRLDTVNAEITGGSVLTHPAVTLSTEFGLELSVAERLLVDADSRVDVSGRGYLGSGMGGNSSASGRTLGNAIEGSTRRNGGGYGGDGGFGNVSGSVNAPYGDATAPIFPGSGGGSDFGPAGTGGGVIRITADTFQLEGSLLANGGVTGSRYGGGGSGGSVWLNVRILAGDGTAAANGGAGGAESGGGGGGRIAVHYEDASAFTVANLVAEGGAGPSPGGLGTVFLQEEIFAPAAPVIDQIVLTAFPGGPAKAGEAPGVGTVVVHWSGRVQSAFLIETSPDLIHWFAAPAVVLESAPGRYEGTLQHPVAARGFFRVRLAATSAGGQ